MRYIYNNHLNESTSHLAMEQHEILQPSFSYFKTLRTKYIRKLMLKLYK